MRALYNDGRDGPYPRTFGWSYKPFVCQKYPFIIPNICLNRPIVCFKRIRAFTLVELVVTLTIAAILATIALPAVGRFVQSNRLASIANNFVGTLSLARSEALKRATNAGVCPSNTGTSCVGTSWASGWIVFVDIDGNAAWTASDVVLRAYEPVTAETTINGSTSLILYDSQGRVPTNGIGSYVVCNTRLGQNRTIEVNASGRFRATQGTCP